MARTASLIAAASFGLLTFVGVAGAEDKKVDFAKDIKPILNDACMKCHSLDNPKQKAAAGFRLDNREAALKGGETGKDIVPGNAKESLMYKLLLGSVKTSDDEIEAMPKHKKGEKFKPLPTAQIELIKLWIDQGANWD